MAKKKRTISEAALSTYFSTHKYYAPVVKEWALSLLRTAAQEKRHLVFLARDGVAPYHAALDLQKSNSQFKDVKIHLKYLSRKVMNHATDPGFDDKFKERKDNLNEYFYKKDKIKPEDKCLFVDVGFMGSMISGIRNEISFLKPPENSASDEEKAKYEKTLLKHYKKICGTVPSVEDYIENNEDLTSEEKSKLTQKEKKAYFLRNLRFDILKEQYPFNFLVSHSQNASGFMGNVEVKLSSVESAGSNRAVHWLEDTHQEVVDSPHFLVKRPTDKEVVPNVLLDPLNPSTRKESNPGEFLIKRTASIAIQDYMQGKVLFDAYEEAQEKERIQFFAELEKENIRANTAQELCVEISTYIKRKGIKNLNINILQACSFILLRKSEELSKRPSGLRKDEVQKIRELLLTLATEINERKSTRYMAGAMATEQTRAIFDKFLLELYNGQRYLYVQHR